MALKFLNKKGWHTGSLRNIENVWKAEQKHEAEQRKLEELRKQIQEERERAEFRLLQERAGLVPRQERLEFLYESGLAVGKGSSDGFKALQGPPKAETSTATTSEPSASKAAVPGSLFVDKPQSANDAWRKLHSDPLLLIRQREQEEIARIKNNPIQMAMIKKSVEAERKENDKGDMEKKKKKEHKRRHRSKSKRDKHSIEYSDSEDMDEDKEGRGDGSRSKHHHSRRGREENGRKVGSASERHFSNIDNDAEKRSRPSYKSHHTGLDHDGWTDRLPADHKLPRSDHRLKSSHTGLDHKGDRKDRSSSKHHRLGSDHDSKSSHKENQTSDACQESGNMHQRRASRLTEEERAARLREMQVDAELHDEQRWKRIRRASEADAQEAAKDKSSAGKSFFLDAAQKSLFGTEKGGSSTIEESVRRRTYYLQGGTAAQERNAFRRQ